MKKLMYAFALVASASIFAVQGKAQVIVIANPSVKASEVSKNDLKDVFTGSSTSLGGSNVVPILMKAGTAHEEFLQAYIGKNDTAYRAGWRTRTSCPPSVRWASSRRSALPCCCSSISSRTS